MIPSLWVIPYAIRCTPYNYTITFFSTPTWEEFREDVISGKAFYINEDEDTPFLQIRHDRYVTPHRRPGIIK